MLSVKFKGKSTLILLGAVIIPAIVLAFFSVGTVRSQRILADKELSKKGSVIATGIREQIEKSFHEAASNAETSILPLLAEVLTGAHISGKITHFPVSVIFVLGKDYNLLYPEIPWEEKQLLKLAPISREFLSEFSVAEAEELQGCYEEAFDAYSNLHSEATSAREHAIILNAMARICAKQSKHIEAFLFYEQIYKNYPLERDLNTAALGAVAYVGCIDMSVKQEKMNRAVDLAVALIQDILNKRLRCYKEESIFYKELLNDMLTNAVARGKLKDAETAAFKIIARQFDKILTAQTIGEMLRLFKNVPSQQYAYLSLEDGKTFLGFKRFPDKNEYIAAFSVPEEQINASVARGIRQAFRYSDSFDYEIIGFNHRRFLASLSHAMTVPTAEENLGDLLPGWQVKVSLKESEAVQKIAQRRMMANLIIVAFLFVIIVVSTRYMLRMLDREKELSKMKTNFVSGVSHEMRTPLTTIRMVSEMFLMRKVQDAATAMEYYAMLKSETERLTRLINNVLDFSRMDSGRKPYQLAEQDLGALVISTAKDFEAYAHASGHTIHLDIERNLPKVRVDADAMSQVLLNLMDNAVKYSPDNKDVQVRLYKLKDHVAMEVRDKGIGIAPDKLNKIFEKFYRGEDELTRQTQGTGIGLAIVRHIINAHKGKIEVKSNQEEGTAFIVTLPVDASSSQPS